MYCIASHHIHSIDSPFNFTTHFSRVAVAKWLVYWNAKPRFAVLKTLFHFLSEDLIVLVRSPFPYNYYFFFKILCPKCLKTVRLILMNFQNLKYIFFTLITSYPYDRSKHVYCSAVYLPLPHSNHILRY